MLRLSRLILEAAGKGPFNPYKILGVPAGASKDEIKKAYHKLALRFHPDSGAEGNAERFAAVNEAYEAVKDGKWQSSASQQQKAAEEGGGGWDSKMGMYVYEQPGSTAESYVKGATEFYLRLFMVGCFVFVFVRLFLFNVLPAQKREQRGAESRGMEQPFVGMGDTAASDAPFPPLPGSGAGEHSIHRDDEADFKWNYNESSSPMKDSLSHR